MLIFIYFSSYESWHLLFENCCHIIVYIIISKQFQTINAGIVFFNSSVAINLYMLGHNGRIKIGSNLQYV